MGAVRRHEGAFVWTGIAREAYERSGLAGVTKQVLIGPRDGAGNFAVRYFELEPGACSSLDVHEHDHGVVVLRGRGIVRLGETRQELAFGDVVYVSPREIHQFQNHGDEPFGFLCVVPPRP
ncbi:MAG: hypothetical protein QOD06_129 [Candidatus Binatota bacterium]|jgi:quercetin dioxygenase-like cupin family protein|nr:hypothetical protein [Candidatus Binatota bacterium]